MYVYNCFIFRLYMYHMFKEAITDFGNNSTIEISRAESN